VSEAATLRMSDIDSERMTLHIRAGKTRRDRYVILSATVYEQLRCYWRSCRFDDYLFPGQQANKPISTASASRIYQQSKRRANIQKSGGIHALRHAFATHMLEAGEGLFTIKQLLGHRSILSTVRYLSFIPNKGGAVKLPIDQLSLES